MYITRKDIERFVACLAREEKSAATIEKYSREALRFLNWLSGEEVSQELACAYKQTLEEVRTPAGVNGAVAALNCLFDFLGLSGCRLRAMKLQRRIFRDEDRELTQSEYRRLLAAARSRGSERLLLVMETICSTGIRVSELRFITVESVRLGRAEVRNKGKIRIVFLPVKLQRVLLKYARAQGLTGGPVFVTRSGNPLDRSNIWADMKTLCATAGVCRSKVFPHNLRHLFARSYYSLEKDIVRLADILGHSSVNTTRIYTMESGYVHRQQLERLCLLL